MSLQKFFVLAVFTLPLCAQTAPKPTLTDALLEARSPLVIADGKFSGAGAAVLDAAVAHAKFVLIGEDHITHEIPQFTAALCDVVHPDAYAVEAGPDAAHFVNSLLRDPARIASMSARGKAHPNNMAFLDIREENDLAAHCAASSHNPRFELWGLDQEFLGSAGTLLESMLATQPGPKSRAAIASLQAREHAADLETRTSGDFSKLFMLAATDADLQPLQQAIAADGNASTHDLLREFTDSQRIYRLNSEGSADSNHIRAELMKSHFLTHYAALKKQTPDARVMFKFGDFHVGKGFNELHQLDLGNFVAELAEGEQKQSLHILVLGARGTHATFTGYAKPLGREAFVMADDRDYKWVADAALDLLPQPAGSTGNTLTLYDLRKLRFRGIDLSPQWQHAVYAFDLFVLIPELTPAEAIP